MVEVSSKSF